MTKTENAVSNAVGDTEKPWQFRKGKSGNPAGKTKGTRNKATIAAQALLEGEAEALTRKVVELALAGDTVALRLCLDRLMPSLKATAPMIALPDPLPESLTDTAMVFLRAAASGQIPPDTATSLIGALGAIVRVEEVETLKARLEALERTLNPPKKKDKRA